MYKPLKFFVIAGIIPLITGLLIGIRFLYIFFWAKEWSYSIIDFDCCPFDVWLADNHDGITGRCYSGKSQIIARHTISSKEIGIGVLNIMRRKPIALKENYYDRGAVSWI